MKALCDANIEVLEQLKDLIHHCEPIYATDTPETPGGIGRHVRHVLDHYRAFRMGMKDRCIDYNLRTRHSLEETEPQAALQQVQLMIDWLTRGDIPAMPINVISEISLQISVNETMPSHSERELLYLINHSIHHMAYAALMARQQSLDIPPHIGLAPGTVSYQRQAKQEQHHV